MGSLYVSEEILGQVGGKGWDGWHLNDRQVASVAAAKARAGGGRRVKELSEVLVLGFYGTCIG